MFRGCYVEHCGGMGMLCGTLWRNVNVVCGCYVEHCGGL